MKILFVSHLRDPSASGRQRLGAMEDLGHEIIPFSLDGFDTQRPLLANLRRRILGTPYQASDQRKLGQRLLAAVAETQPELVWIEKSLMLLPQCLAEIRAIALGATFVCFQDDDPFGLRRSERVMWGPFVACIPLYDVHFVKKAIDIDEFKRHGAKNVMLFVHGVYEPVFHPVRQAPTDLREVSFVGTPLDHRVAYIQELLEHHSIPLHVYGNHWNRKSIFWRKRSNFHAEVVGNNYADLLRRSKICLGFVSSSNRDEYSMRTFEIPGCATFLLAERTPMHSSLFEEGVEAEFFSNVEECADKCRFYLQNEEARQRIARAGYARCQQSHYFLRHRLADALERLQSRNGASVAE